METLRSARLTLEPLEVRHAEAMFRVLSDPAIYEFENEPPASVEWLRDRFARLESRRSRDGSQQWLNWVLRRDDGELIGYVQATVHRDGHAAIAYELASAHWGRGYASEALGAMIDAVVASYGVARLSAVLKRTNHRSLKLLQRLGFTRAHEEDGVQIEPDELMMSRAAVPAGGVGQQASRT
jgi:ribosomal-protein-alanine N-acetyltransferase